jgi:uncharacterized protein (DUF2147 family)
MKKLLSLCAAGGLLFTSAVWAQTPSFPLTGHWMFVEDQTVIGFTACGDAVCARIRGLPTLLEPGEKPPACDLEVLMGFKPNGARWVGEALDPESNKRYRARLQAGKQGGELELVISALGGLVSESMVLAPAKDFKPCN